jgi:uncharacterized protein (UPF0332 family)
MERTVSTSDQDLLAFSSSILMPDAPEVALRAAISRSYYGVFHHSKVLADAWSLPPAPEKYRGSHEKTIFRLVGFDDGTAVEMLKKQKMMRVKADYHLTQEITLVEASMHVASCKALSGQFSMYEMVNPGTH